MRFFYSVGDRCYIDLPSLRLPVSSPDALDLLRKAGFVEESVDISAIARAAITTATYRLNACISESPNVMDCCSFTKWLFGLKGIRIPRLPMQQYSFGTPVDLDHLRKEDLIFTSSRSRPHQKFGHVCLYTGETSVAAIPNVCIARGEKLEMSLEELFTHREFRGACRISAPTGITLKIPDHYSKWVESSDDLHYLVLSFVTG